MTESELAHYLLERLTDEQPFLRSELPSIIADVDDSIPMIRLMILMGTASHNADLVDWQRLLTVVEELQGPGVPQAQDHAIKLYVLESISNSLCNGVIHTGRVLPYIGPLSTDYIKGWDKVMGATPGFEDE